MSSMYDLSMNTFAERNKVDHSAGDGEGKESSEMLDAVLMAAHILSNAADTATQETLERRNTADMLRATPVTLRMSSSPTLLVPELSNSPSSSYKESSSDTNNNTARSAEELISSVSSAESSDMPVEAFVYNYTLARSLPSIEASHISSSSQLMPVSTETTSQEMYSYIAQPPPLHQTQTASTAPSSSSTESGSDTGEPSQTMAYNVCDRSLFPADSTEEVVPADAVDADASMVLSQDEAFLRSGTPSRAHSAGDEQMMFGSRPNSLLESFYLNRAASWNSHSSSNVESLSSRSDMRLSGHSTGRPNFFVERARQLAMRQSSTASSNAAGAQGAALPVSPPPMTAQQQQQQQQQQPTTTTTTTVTRTTSSVASLSMRNLLGGYWLWRGKAGLYASDVSDRGWTDNGPLRMPTTTNPTSSPAAPATARGGVDDDATRADGTAGPASGYGSGVTHKASNLSRNAPPTPPSPGRALPLISSTEERIRSPSGKHFTTNVTTTTTTTTLRRNSGDGPGLKPRYINGVRIFRGSFDNDASLDSSPFITHGNGSMRTEHGLGRRMSQVGFVCENSNSSIRLPISTRGLPSSFSVPVSGATIGTGGTPVANAAATWRLLSFKKQDDGPVKPSSGGRRKKKGSKGSKDRKHKEKRSRKNNTNNRHAEQNETGGNSPGERALQQRPRSPVEVHAVNGQANGDRATTQETPPLVPRPPSRQSNEPPARHLSPMPPLITPEEAQQMDNVTLGRDDEDDDNDGGRMRVFSEDGEAEYARGRRGEGRLGLRSSSPHGMARGRPSYVNGTGRETASSAAQRAAMSKPTPATTARSPQGMTPFDLAEPRARTSPGSTAAAAHLPRNDAATRHAMTQPYSSDGVPRRRNTVRRTPFLFRLLNMNNDTRSVNGGEPHHGEHVGHNRSNLRASFDDRRLPSLT